MAKLSISSETNIYTGSIQMIVTETLKQILF